MPDTNDLSPQGLTWKRVSPDYIKVRLISGTISTVIWTVGFGIPLILGVLGIWGDSPAPWMWFPPAVVLVWGLIDLCLIPRRVRAIGYAEESTELWLRKGIIFRSVTVVPYGRMQYVDIKTGPLLNAFGQLVKADFVLPVIGHWRAYAWASEAIAWAGLVAARPSARRAAGTA